MNYTFLKAGNLKLCVLGGIGAGGISTLACSRSSSTPQSHNHCSVEISKCRLFGLTPWVGFLHIDVYVSPNNIVVSVFSVSLKKILDGICSISSADLPYKIPYGRPTL